jgi:hypothetical protein
MNSTPEPQAWDGQYLNQTIVSGSPGDMSYQRFPSWPGYLIQVSGARKSVLLTSSEVMLMQNQGPAFENHWAT